MRFTPVMAFAVLLACLPAPARAVELIELHDTAQLTDYQPTSDIGVEWAVIPSATTLFDAPLFAGRWPAPVMPRYPPAHPPTHPTTPTPVPEPVSVLMLACGLLLMVPGAWAARWSRLGDRKSLLKWRHP